MSETDGTSAGAPRVSVVIRSYNEARFIGRLMEGLARQLFRDFEIILVDSGSTDATVALARQGGARIVTMPKADFSFGRSLNLGCAAARGEILVFASAHVYPTRTDWLSHMVAPFAEDRVALVYGKQRGDAITKFSEHRVFEKWFPEESDGNQLHHFCNNANCAILKSWWETLRYDETLTGLEDLAWAKEAMRRGARIVYNAEAEIVHVHDESFDRIRNRYFREALALKHIEPNLKFGFLDFCWLTVSNIVADCREAAHQGVLAREWKNIALFRANQFWGTYKGHRFHAPVTRQVKDRFYFPAPRAAARPSGPAIAAPGAAQPAGAGPAREPERINYSRL